MRMRIRMRLREASPFSAPKAGAGVGWRVPRLRAAKKAPVGRYEQVPYPVSVAA